MNLYEIMYEKTQLNLDGSSLYTQIKRYQVVASSQLNAAFVLGTIFNGDDYEINVKNIKLVLKGD